MWKGSNRTLSQKVVLKTLTKLPDKMFVLKQSEHVWKYLTKLNVLNCRTTRSSGSPGFPIDLFRSLSISYEQEKTATLYLASSSLASARGKKPTTLFLQLVPGLVGQEQKINTTLPLIARDLQVLRSE